MWFVIGRRCREGKEMQDEVTCHSPPTWTYQRYALVVTAKSGERLSEGHSTLSEKNIICIRLFRDGNTESLEQERKVDYGKDYRLAGASYVKINRNQPLNHCMYSHLYCHSIK